METRATLRGVRLSVDKGRLVADLIRGKKVDQALNILQFTQKKAAVIIKKVLESAIANAEHNDGADIDELKVKTIYVEQGASLRRFTARAKGRGNQAQRGHAQDAGDGAKSAQRRDAMHRRWPQSVPTPGSCEDPRCRQIHRCGWCPPAAAARA